MSSNKKKVSIVGLVAMLCVTVAGGGFGVEDMVGGIGPGMTMLAFMILPFIWSLPFGLSSAELSSAYPENGGMYTWAKNELGEKAGFVSGWCYTIAGFVEPATFAALTANYIQTLIPFEISHLTYWLICVAVITTFAIINFFGIRVVSNLATVFTILCMIPFLVMIYMAFISPDFDIHYLSSQPLVPEGMTFWEVVGRGLLLGIWFLTGFETISTMSGEIEDGEKRVPRAILIAIPVVSLIYIMWIMPALMTVGNWQDWSSEGPLSFVEIGLTICGPVLGLSFMVASILASMINLCEYVLAYAQLMQEFSARGMFFRVFRHEHKKYHTPYAAIIILSAVSAIICTSGSYIEFVGIASILYAVPVILMLIANIRMRLTKPDLELAFKAPLPNKVYITYLCLPIVIYSASVFADNWIVGLGLALSSVPAYIFFKKIYYKGRYWNN